MDPNMRPAEFVGLIEQDDSGFHGYRYGFNQCNTVAATQNLVIRELELFKGLQHEILLVTVFDTKAARLYYAVIERTGIAELKALTLAPRSSSTTSLPRTSTSSHPIADSASVISQASNVSTVTAAISTTSKRKIALDKLTWVGSNWSKWLMVERLQKCTFAEDSQPYYFSDLVILASLVHAMYPHYALLTKNCHWYASVILDVIALFSVASEHAQPEATLPGMKKGAYKALLTTYKNSDPKTRELIELVFDKYKKEVESFRIKIRDRERVNINAALSEANAARADNAEVRADNAEARADAAEAELKELRAKMAALAVAQGSPSRASEWQSTSTVPN
ncbi:hypothetical protein H0H93_004184 [Arthromyces matolae]|nr:hypothetical protein H0H93_004184 [Arthromyces matolae]